MKRKIVVGITMLILITIITNTIKGVTTDSFKAEVSPQTASLKPGEELTVSVSVLDIDMGENGINVLEGMISYDKDIFEEVKASNIQSLHNWTTTYNDESSTLNGKFLAANLSAGVKEDTQLFTVKFKVKKDIKESLNTQIDFKDITSNNGTDLVNVGTKSVKVTVEVDKPVVEEPKNEIEEPSKDNTQAKDPIPQTGVSYVILAGTAGVGVIAFIIRRNYKSYKDVK